MTHYTPSEIRELYDGNPNMTLKQLARITGRTTWNLKAILMPRDDNACVADYVAEGLGEK